MSSSLGITFFGSAIYLVMMSFSMSFLLRFCSHQLRLKPFSRTYWKALIISLGFIILRLPYSFEEVFSFSVAIAMLSLIFYILGIVTIALGIFFLYKGEKKLSYGKSLFLVFICTTIICSFTSYPKTISETIKIFKEKEMRYLED
jgi:hypothetical protein